MKDMLACLIVQVDGTPGVQKHRLAGLGLVLRGPEGQVLAWRCTLAAAETNNEAEYQAVIAGIRLALEYNPLASIICLSDSRVVIEQLHGSCAVRSPSLRALHAEAKTVMERAIALRLVFIPRELNRLADALAWEALDRHGWVVRAVGR